MLTLPCKYGLSETIMQTDVFGVVLNIKYILSKTKAMTDYWFTIILYK